jgi:hypothetical protein
MLFCACALPARASSIQARYAVAECPRAKAAAPASMGSCTVVWAWPIDKSIVATAMTNQRAPTASILLNIIFPLPIVLAGCRVDRLRHLGKKALAILTICAQHLNGWEHLGLEAHQTTQVRQFHVVTDTEMLALPTIRALVHTRGSDGF